MALAYAPLLPQKNTSLRDSTQASHFSAVRRVIEAFRGNLEQPIDLESMARIALASPFHFNRMFRRIAGIPPCQFLYAMRLQAAAEMLIATDRSVLDICYEVGYNSLGTFTRRFTELVGLPPTRLRAMAKSMAHDELQHELERIHALTDEDSEDLLPYVRGSVNVPEDFTGIVMIGLFPEAIPQGRPVAGTLVLPGHPYAIPKAPDGTYFLFAAGIPTNNDPLACFTTQKLPRGGGQQIEILNGIADGCPDISLHEPAVTDPPILVALPLLMKEFLSREMKA